MGKESRQSNMRMTMHLFRVMVLSLKKPSVALDPKLVLVLLVGELVCVHGGGGHLVFTCLSEEY